MDKTMHMVEKSRTAILIMLNTLFIHIYPRIRSHIKHPSESPAVWYMGLHIN